ncbi:DMT family transporter [Natronobacterium texcoconense]|uniref:Permease of the drug/metabolite transporter (DMT) superfamily n=1 Tax=Natronobacterium texcoconense TaxID=1095778 RepID=A0A1H1EFV0_NATTX|nr:DMT family transporter [Natronobacterium texcoconense]SDQ87597.1 Permease of the drug/metabolite transporter (DMT) superfamily [Natronobacterium texcoconense]
MSRYRNFGLFLTLAACWGTAFVAISAGLEHFPPVLFAALRYDVAGIVMLAYAAYTLEGDEWLPHGRDEWAVVAVGAVLLIAAYHAFLFVGQQNTTAAAAAILVSLSPVLTTGFARALVPSDALSVVGVFGVVLGLVGVAVISQPDPADLLAPDFVAKLLVFCAAASFALGSVLTRRIDASLPIETMEAWSMLGGALVMHAISLGLGEPIEPAAWTHPEALGALAYLALVASALGFLLYFDLLERLGAVEINMVSYVAPIFTAIVGWLYLGEVVDATTLLGFALIVAGFAVVKRRALREEFDHVNRIYSRE